MHSPSRVQIPPSPRMTPALRKKRGGFRIRCALALARTWCVHRWGYRVIGQNVLVLWRLFGLLVRKKRCSRCLFHRVGMNTPTGPIHEPISAHLGPTTRTWARQLARGPDNSHVGPIGGDLGPFMRTLTR